MTIVASYDWESDTWTHNGDNPARVAWREAVAEIAAKAKAALPEAVHGRVEKAVQIVLNGDVEVLPDGKTKVASQSNGTTQYVVCNGTCECRDFAKAGGGWCKHRAAAAIHQRTMALAKAKLDTLNDSQAVLPSPPAPTQPQASPAVTSTPLPEAPASVNVHLELAGRQVQLTLRDSDEGRLLQRLDAILQRFPLVVKPTDTTPQCPKHGIPMTLNHGKDRSTWYSRTTGHWFSLMGTFLPFEISTYAI